MVAGPFSSLGLVALVLAAGCSTVSTSRSVPETHMPASAWAPALSPDQAKALTPEEAKAILVARAALEQEAKKGDFPPPNVLAYKVTATAAGWEVYVSFVGMVDNGKVYGAPGYFSVVSIDKAWNVTGIVGGA